MLSKWYVRLGPHALEVLTKSLGSSCLDALQAEPFCADSAWVLWNATMETVGPTGYFCCLPGQIGTQQFNCDSGAVNVAATLSAQSVRYSLYDLERANSPLLAWSTRPYRRRWCHPERFSWSEWIHHFVSWK
jgi:hypothetical protein